MSRSIHLQISVARKQQQQHQQTLRWRLAQLKKGIHQQLTSPEMFLLAAGSGFLLGEFTPRAGSRSTPRSKGTKGAKNLPLVLFNIFLRVLLERIAAKRI